MLRSNLSKFIAVFAIAAVLVPTAAFAHGGRDGRVNLSNTNEFGIQILGDHDGEREHDDNRDNDKNNGKHKGNNNYEFNRARQEAKRDLRKSFSKSLVSGEVTAMTDTQLTLQTEDNKTVTVNTDGTTKVVGEDGNPATTADIEVGADVKAFGFWDTVVHVFNAIKIKLF